MRPLAYCTCIVLLAAFSVGCEPVQSEEAAPTPSSETKAASHAKSKQTQEKVVRSDKEWRELLTDEQYRVLRLKGTEPRYTNEYDHHFEPGSYACAACGQVLFESDTKFNSGCGWPAFYAAKAGERVNRIPDYSAGMVRVEVTCARCDSHLGHVFNDAPDQPTGERYCINSVSLKFIPKEEPPKGKQVETEAQGATPSPEPTREEK